MGEARCRQRVRGLVAAGAVTDSEKTNFRIEAKTCRTTVLRKAADQSP